jgi:glutathione S-transferase
MKIYANPMSPSAKRALVCARELGIPHEVVNVQFGKESRGTEYMARNPMGKVPVLEDDDGWMLWESPAILYYLADQHGSSRLMPADARGRADTLRWMFWNATHWEGSGWTVVGERVFKPMYSKDPPDEDKSADSVKFVAKYTEVLDAHLGGREWIAGNAFSIADIALATSAELFVMARLELGTNVTAWLARVTARPSWSSTT